ncbi:unnamed protein product [Effrenium voratum]|nr:unnamed protein product [Effrenium voratum]CAJ1448388.1 unnamed protein product [Effrenium voratum]
MTRAALMIQAARRLQLARRRVVEEMQKIRNKLATERAERRRQKVIEKARIEQRLKAMEEKRKNDAAMVIQARRRHQVQKRALILDKQQRAVVRRNILGSAMKELFPGESPPPLVPSTPKASGQPQMGPLPGQLPGQPGPMPGPMLGPMPGPMPGQPPGMPSQMPMAPMPYGMPDAEHEGEFSDYGAYMDAGYPYPEESPGPYPGQQTPSQTPHSLSQTQGSQAAGSYVPDPHAAHPFHGPAYVPGAHAPPGHGPGQYGAPAGYGYGTPTSGAVSPRSLPGAFGTPAPKSDPRGAQLSQQRQAMLRRAAEFAATQRR